MNLENINRKTIDGVEHYELRDVHAQSGSAYPFTVWLQKRIESLKIDSGALYDEKRAFAVGRPKVNPYARKELALCFMATQSHKAMKDILLKALRGEL